MSLPPEQDGRGPGPDQVPPTAVRLLPVLIATFAASWLIDVGTDWPVWVRWILSIAAGMAAGVIAVSLWARGRRS